MIDDEDRKIEVMSNWSEVCLPMREAETAFKQEYSCIPYEPSAEYKRAEALWAQYYFSCEAFDRSVCSRFDDKRKEALPANEVELRLINQHAMRRWRELHQEARWGGISREVLNEAKMSVGRWSFDTLTHYINHGR